MSMVLAHRVCWSDLSSAGFRGQGGWYLWPWQDGGVNIVVKRRRLEDGS